jgi:hypothetical protein
MRTAVLLFVLCLITVLSLSGCEASCSFSTAKLTDAQVAKSIHPDTQAPWETASTFGPDADAIYAVAKLSSAPEGTRVKASFHYLENGERQIADDEIEASGGSWVSFTLSPPDSGWPSGQYEARFHLNGKEVQRVPFNVAAGSAPTIAQTRPAAQPATPVPPAPRETPPSRPAPGEPPQPKPPAPPPARTEETQTFREDRFGFTLEVPASWSYRVTPDKDYLIEGPQGTDAFEISILLQFVTKATNPGSSAIDQAQELLDQILRVPDAEVRTQEMVTMAGQEVPYFVASYTAKNSRQEPTTFGHMQVVLDHGDYYYLVSYSGPADIYQRFAPVFEQVVETFRFTDD